MDIKYNILEFNKDTGSVLVNYFCDDCLEGLTYNIDLPIENGQFPSQETIGEFITLMEPRGQLNRIVGLKTTTVPQFLLDKIPVPTVIVPPTIDQPIISGVNPLPGA